MGFYEFIKGNKESIFSNGEKEFSDERSESLKIQKGVRFNGVKALRYEGNKLDKYISKQSRQSSLQLAIIEETSPNSFLLTNLEPYYLNALLPLDNKLFCADYSYRVDFSQPKNSGRLKSTLLLTKKSNRY